MWDRESECICGIEIDDEIEQCRLHHREVGGLISVEHTPNVVANLTVYPGEAWAAIAALNLAVCDTVNSTLRCASSAIRP